MSTEKDQEINLMAVLYNGCKQLLDEAQRRLMLGQMVIKADCRGAITLLSNLTGAAFRTIKRGFSEAYGGWSEPERVGS